MAATEKIQIKFEALGAKGLQQAINAVSLASDRLTKSQKQYEKALVKLNTKQKKMLDGMFEIQTANRNVGNSFSVVRSKMLLASFAVAIIGGTLGRLVKKSAEAEEVIGKVNVVFGSQATIVKEWAEVFGNEVGRATTEVLKMVSSLQDTFVPLGFTREGAASLSTTLAILAVDVASLNNQLDSKVAKDFQSAIVGNHETVLKYGIVINEASLKQEAFKLGLADGVKTLNTQQKVMARVSLIQKGSTDAQGDAIRTSKSFINQQKAISANLQESAEAFGDFIKAVLTAGYHTENLNISLMGLARHLTSKEYLVSFAAGLTLVGIGLAYVKRSAIAAALATKAMKVALIRTGIGALVIILGEVIYRFSKWMGWMDETGESSRTLKEQMDELAKSTGMLTVGSDEYFMSIAKSQAAMEKRVSLLKATSREEKLVIELRRELTDIEKDLLAEEDELIAKQKEEKNLLQVMQSAYNSLIDVRIANIQAMLLEIEAMDRTAENIEFIEGAYEGLNNKLDKLIKNRDKADNTTALEKYTEKTRMASEALNKRIVTEQIWGRDYITRLRSLTEVEKMEIKFKTELADLDDAAKAKALEYATAIDEVKQSLIDRAEATKKLNYQTQLSIESMRVEFSEQGNLLGQKSRLNELRLSESINLEKQVALNKALNEGLINEQDFNIAILQLKTEEADIDQEIHDQKIANFEELASAVNNIANSYFALELAELKEQKTTELLAAKSIRNARLREKKVSAIEKKFKEKEDEIKRDQQKVAILLAITNTALGITKALSAAEPPRNFIMAGLVAAAGAMEIATIKAQKFAKGGLVGGNFHTAGGTIIEAEKGEYVVSRAGVDAIGLENLNKINEGEEGGSPFVININNPILAKDIIEDEIVPQLKEALRRGGDIGL